MMVKKPTLLISLNPNIKHNFLGVRLYALVSAKTLLVFLVYLLGMLLGFSV